MIRIIMETRPIVILYGGEYECVRRVPVVAWVYNDEYKSPPEPLIINEEYPSLTIAPEEDYRGMEIHAPDNHIPIMVYGHPRPSTVRCPLDNGRYIDVREGKLWRVALAFGDEDWLSQRRWENAGCTRDEIRGIVNLFADAQLCERPTPRRRTNPLPNVTRDSVIAFVARVTTTQPESPTLSSHG